MSDNSNDPTGSSGEDAADGDEGGDGEQRQQLLEAEEQQEERVAWLRERGVEIETPEERRLKQLRQAHSVADRIAEEEDETEQQDDEDVIYYVKIPADTSRPLEELRLRTKPPPPSTAATTADGSVDVLAEHLKATAFRTNGGAADADAAEVDLSLLEQQSTTTLASGNVAPQVSDETLRQVAKEGHVETFCLVRPGASSSTTTTTTTAGIQLYLDEIGMLKRLPMNPRASRFAEIAGYNPPPTFYGDVYMGKVVSYDQSSPSFNRKQRNASLRLEEAQLDAPWLREAAVSNLEYQLERNRAAGIPAGDAPQQPNQPGTDGKEEFASREGYSWTQTEEELEVRIPIPAAATDDDDDIATAKLSDVKKAIGVKFRSQGVDATYRKLPLLSLRLFERVDIDGGCTWTIERQGKGGKVSTVLVATMEKIEPALWPRIQY